MALEKFACHGGEEEPDPGSDSKNRFTPGGGAAWLEKGDPSQEKNLSYTAESVGARDGKRTCEDRDA